MFLWNNLEFAKFNLAFIILTLSTSFSHANNSPLTPIVISANYTHPYRNLINSTIEYVFIYSETIQSLEAKRIIVESEDATADNPLIVIARQKKGVLSWQIPLQVENKHVDNTLFYNRTSRTLCPSKYYKTIKFGESHNYVTISITTASLKNISFYLELKPVLDFYVKPGDSRSYNITPSEPVYYGYNFQDLSNSSSVLINVQSNSSTCMTFSIQNTSCPVFDLERNIEFAGYWQTVSWQGGITVPKIIYPNGFFIVFVVNADDKDCSDKISVSDRRKFFNVTITNSIKQSDYIIASFSAATIFVTFCLCYIIGSICYKIQYSRMLREQFIQDEFDHAQQANISPDAQHSGFQEVENNTSNIYEEDSSLDEDDIDLMHDAFYAKEIIRTKLILSVCDLARKEPRILRKKSRLYVYYLITVAIFYTAPVIQLVVTYQNVLHVTGNQDLCYYNFLCSHPLQFLSDFNHVFSNLGYILLGLLFIFIVYMREKYDNLHYVDRGLGIPQHYGLFYAMGFALMMEGILSGSYHFCPNHSNFQFDTSFMYVIAVLCMVKIYQNRHPDINAQAPTTFGVLAITILLGLIGVLEGQSKFWIFFTVCHLLTCLILSAHIYYMGQWKFDGGVFRRMIMTMRHNARSGISYIIQPIYWRRFLLLVMGNLCNLALAIYGNMNNTQDFATYLLMVLMVNLLLYTFFYIIMKLCYKEKILFQPLIYIILSFGTWSGALYFFTNKTISWALTPAESRQHNKPCIKLLFNFYDNHDVWHFLSALAMFFSFMSLLTLDDDLQEVHRSLIPVF